MLDDFEELKRKVERIKTDRDKAEGAYQQMLSRLKEEFGCTSLKSAEQMLRQLEEKERKWAVKFAAEKKAFEEKWKNQLSED